MKNQTSTKKEFKCERCGLCCINTFRSFDRDEVKKISKLEETRKRNVKFTKYKFGIKSGFTENGKAIGVEYCYFTDSGLYNITIASPNNMRFKPCEYLDKDENGKYYCSIYPYRPSVCRDFAVTEGECLLQKERLKRWHEQAEIGRRDALKRERNTTIIAIVILVVLLLIVIGFIWLLVVLGTSCYQLFFGT